jgi:hypothetical protein
LARADVRKARALPLDPVKGREALETHYLSEVVVRGGLRRCIDISIAPLSQQPTW